MEEKNNSDNSICPPDKIIYDEERGEYICEETGEVLEEKVIDQGADWRAFTPEERVKRSRVGSPIDQSIHDLGISTIIDWKDTDAYGNKLNSKRKLDAMKWRKWQLRSRVKTSSERNLYQAMQEIDRIGGLLNLPKSVKNEASMIYRKALEKNLTRGRSIEEIVAASIYTACRRMKVARSLDEISQYTKARKKELAKAYRLIIKTIDLEVPTSDPKDHIIRITDLLNLSGSTVKMAINIIEKAKETGITSGKDPAGVAAAAVYIASVMNDERRTQHDIAAVAGVTEVTIRNRYKELAKELKINMPEV